MIQKYPRRYFYPIDIFRDGFKQAALENDVRIKAVQCINDCAGLLPKSTVIQPAFLTPSINCPTNEFGPDIFDHTDVVLMIRIDSFAFRLGWRQEKSHRDRSVEIVLQHVPGNSFVIKMIGRGLTTNAS